MTPLKFAIIGLGNIGKRHVQALSDTSNAKLVAVCDIDKSKCKPDSNICSEVEFFEDYTKLLAKSDAEIVCIASPHGLHAQMAIDCMKAGKHVIVEKPMALTIYDCDKMNQVSIETNKKLFIVKQNRFNKPIIVTTKALEENRLGKIYLVQCNVFWNRGEEYYTESDWRGIKALEGGALHTQVSHFLDLLTWWFGELSEAKSIIDTVHHNIEIEDVGVSTLKFNSGVIGSLSWTTNVYNKNYEGSITIIGETGTIKIGGKYLNKIEYWDVKSYPMPIDIDFNDGVNEYGKYQGSSSNHDIMFHEIIEHFTKKRKGIVEGVEGEKSVRATEMIYAST